MTKLWVVKNEYNIEEPSIREAADLLRQGEQVAFPTETVYGLGADARNTEAVDGIFRAKGRPSDNPLIVHIAEEGMLFELATAVDEVSLRLARAFWPGPLTLVLPVRPGAVSPRVTAGLDTVAVRMPAHPVALSLIAAAGCPVAAPSANRSGRPSPTLAEHVREDLAGRIAGIVDAGAAGVGLESTVAEVGVDGRVHVLRPGGVTPAELARVAGCEVVVAGERAGGSGEGGGATGSGGGAAAAVADAAAGARGREAEGRAAPAGEAVHDDESFRPKAPGMKYAHYAPQGRLAVVQGGRAEAVASRILQELDQARAAGEVTGVLAPEEHAHLYRDRADLVVSCGSLRDPESTARELFAALRRFDEAGATCIFAEAFAEEGIGLAVMNRLRKAAANTVIKV